MSFWDALASVGSAIGDGLDTVVDTVTDVIDDAGQWVEETVEDTADDVSQWAGRAFGSLGESIANVVGGLVVSVVTFLSDLNSAIVDLVQAQTDFWVSILKLDFAGALVTLGEYFMALAGLGLVLLRWITGGYITGGVLDRFRASGLRRFVSALVDATFTGDARIRARNNIGLDGNNRFGFRINAEHRVFMLDSANTDLVAMHNSGAIDLYQLAGVPSLDTFELAPRARTRVVSVGNDGNNNLFPINRYTITRHLRSGGTENRLRVYALEPQVAAENMRTLRRKTKQLGLVVDWSDQTYFAMFTGPNTQEIADTEYRFPRGRPGEIWLDQRGLHSGTPSEDSTLIQLAVFRFIPTRTRRDDGTIRVSEVFGTQYGREHSNDITACTNPGRTDICCCTIERSGDNQTLGSGTAYRDHYPAWIFRTVGTHETGHWAGLCHNGHDISDIMYTAQDNQGTAPVLPGIWTYYIDRDPRFTAKDARNTWRFLVDQMSQSLTA